ncbi:MAG: HAMP domain-containing histidine kinase [Bacteroidetes bacterium]|nr:HAMP domain-containing histidine kinase [Bacteroidota bacterium]MCH8524580.1 HAMP domain-containing histidine kinase [Balneolales bacterium]
MHLQTRFILFIGIILTAVAATVWFGIRPAYESAILAERITIISEQQRERIELGEAQLGSWTAVLVEIQENLRQNGDIQQSRILFSGFSTLIPELIGLRLIDQNSGEFVELRSVQSNTLPSMSGAELSPLGSPASAQFDSDAATNLFVGWDTDSGYLTLSSVFNLGNESYRLMAVYSDEEFRNTLLSDALGVDSRTVIWLKGTERGVVSGGALPDTRPEYEPVTRFRELSVDGMQTIVVSTPIASLQALHAMYIDPSAIRGPIRRLFSQSMMVLTMVFFTLTLASLVVFNQLSRPVRHFLQDILPMANYDFSKPVRASSVAELQELTSQMDQIREKLAYYQRINVEQIITNQERINLLMEYASDPIAVFNGNGEFTFRNNPFVDLFLHADEPAPGSILKFDESHLFISVKELENREYRIRPLLVRSEGREVKLINDDSEKVYFYNQQRVSVFNEEGSLAGGLLILYDLTRERELDQLRNDMINIIVHELKNPIAGIRGLTSVLIDDPEFTQEEFAEIYGLIDDSAASLQELVERFMQVSRLESNLANVEFNSVDMSLLVKETADELSILLNEKSLKFNLKLSEEIQPVMASYELLKDAARNLLSNAIKYGGRDRVIDVEVRLDAFGYNQTDLLFCVTDYGYGIPEEHRENIFKKFYRIKEHNMEKGTGLGLPHVREIVRLHEGSIQVESNKQIGSRFTIRIPYRPIAGGDAS